MKKILGILSVMGLVFFTSSRVMAQAIEKPPIRTLDPHPAIQRAIPVALPVKSGSGEKTITSARRAFQPGAVKAALPPMRAGSAAGPRVDKAIPVSAGSAKLPVKGTGATNNQ